MREVAASEPALDRALARSLFVVAVFAALAGAARVGQDSVIAWRYGSGATADAYYYVLSLVSWPVAVATSTLTLLVAPVEAAMRTQRPGVAGQFRGELLGAMLLMAVALTPLAWWSVSALVGGRIIALQPSVATQASLGVAGLIWAVPVGVVGALLSAWLVSAGRRSLTLIEAMPPLMLILALTVLPGQWLYWGTTLGVVLQVIAMGLVLNFTDALPKPRFGLRAAAWTGFSRGAVMLLLSQALFTLVPLVDPLFAAGMAESAVATISYANRLVLGVQGLVGLALQRTSLPLMSRWMAQDPVAACRVALRWALLAAGGGAVLGLAISLCADTLVSLLYERGLFTTDDRVQVAQLLRYGMLQLPSFMGGLVLVAALASAGARRALALVAVLGLATKLLVSFALAESNGAVGLMLATAAMYLVTAVVACIALVKWRPA